MHVDQPAETNRNLNVRCHSGKFTRLIELGTTSLAKKINQFHINNRHTVTHSKFPYRPMKIALNLHLYFFII